MNRLLIGVVLLLVVPWAGDVAGADAEVSSQERALRTKLAQSATALAGFDAASAKSPIVARRNLIEMLREHIRAGKGLVRKLKAATLPQAAADVVTRYDKERRRIGNQISLAAALESQGEGAAATKKLHDLSEGYQALCKRTVSELKTVERVAVEPPTAAGDDAGGGSSDGDTGDEEDPSAAGADGAASAAPIEIVGLTHRVLKVEDIGTQVRVLLAPSAAPPKAAARLVDAGVVFRTVFDAQPAVVQVEIMWVEYMQSRFGERKHMPVARTWLARSTYERMIWKNLTLDEQGALYDQASNAPEGWRALPPSKDPSLADGSKVSVPVAIEPSVKPFFDFRKPFKIDAPGWRGTFRESVDRALVWLAAHQSPNGSWEAANFGNWLDGKAVKDPAKRPDGAGKAFYDVGVTGLALCAFLGAGHHDLSRHPYGAVVRNGLSYLRKAQDKQGCFGPRKTQQFVYNHAMASLAMVEGYALSGNGRWHGSAQRALDFVALSRQPYFGWRYGVKPGDSDTSVTGWMMQVLYAASRIEAVAKQRGEESPLIYDQSSNEGAYSWLQQMTDADTGQVGYLTRGTGSARPQEQLSAFPNELTEAMTAAGLLIRFCVGKDPQEDMAFRRGAERCLRLVPKWERPRLDLYYWYYASSALVHGRSAHWERWRAHLGRALLPNQRKDDAARAYGGSWDPISVWSLDGGRVYSTAMGALCLQAAWRYTTGD